MVSPFAYHALQWDKIAPVIVHYEGVVQEHLQNVLKPSSHVEISLWRHHVSCFFWELECILDLNTLISVV